MFCTIETVTERPAVFDVDNDQMVPESAGERQIKEDNVKKSPTPPRRHPNVIPIVFSNSLHDGACFIDDEHFRQVYDAHCHYTRAGFRKAASERTVNMGDEISAQFEYNYVKFQCPRVGKPRIRGYLNQGCPANIFLKFNRENFCYQITRCSLSHSHPLVALDVLTAAKSLHRPRSSVPRTPKSRAEMRQRYASRTPASSRGVAIRERPDLDESLPSSSLPEMSLSLPSQTLPELVEVQNRLNTTDLGLQILQNLNFQPASVQNPLNLQPQPIDQTNDQENNPSMAAITNQFSAILTLNGLNPNEPTLPLPTMEQWLQHMNSFRSGQ